MLGKIKHKAYLTYTSTITAWLTAIAAGIRLVLGKIKHKTYSIYTSTITAWLTAIHACIRLVLGKIKQNLLNIHIYNHSLADGYYCWYQTYVR